MNKSDLMEWLRDNQIDFPESATVRHLRSLYEDHVGAQGRAPRASDSDPLPEQEDPLDMELRVLQKRKMIADLRRELDNFDNEQMQARPPIISDVLGSVPKFSGSDTCDANRWLNDFESTCESVGGDDDFMYKCIRRLMEPGTEADWFLRVDKSANYQDFRVSFLDNFGHNYTVAEVIDRLRKTTFDAARIFS